MDASMEYIDEMGGEETEDAIGSANIPTSTTSNYQHSIPSTSYHAIFGFLDTVLLGVLQIEYQSKKETPFDTHPLQMQTFLTSICIYCATLGIMFHTKTQILSYVLLLSGALSSLSLLSILLWKQLLWIVLIVWGSIPIILARHLLKSSTYRIINMVAKLARDVCNLMFATGTMFSTIFGGGNNNNSPRI